MQTFRILVVDDFEMFRRSIRFILGQRPEFQVIGEASDGLEAVQKAVELKPHLILLDAGLPKMDGIDAARQIRNLVPESRILLMNYESDSDLVQETLSLGISGYIVKTSAARELLRFRGSRLQGREILQPRLSRSRAQRSKQSRALSLRSSTPRTKSFRPHSTARSPRESIKDFYRASAAAALLATEFRGSIADFSGVTRVHATPNTIREIAALPPADPVVSRPRVVVAPNSALLALARLFQFLGKATRPNLHVVRNLNQAFSVLGVTAPRFEPILPSTFAAEPAPTEIARHAYSL